MANSQSDRRSTARMSRGARIIYLVGVEAQTLAEHLGEVPTAVEAIRQMQDEASRREAIRIVDETRKQFRSLYWDLQLAITKLTELCNGQETDGGLPHAIETAGATAIPNG